MGLAELAGRYPDHRLLVFSDGAGFVNPWEDRRLWEVWPVEPPGAGMADLDAVIGGPPGAVIDHYVRLQLAIGYAFY